MKIKTAICIPVVLCTLLLTGCRMVPVHAGPEKIEKIAREAINSGVTCLDEAPEESTNYSGIDRIYTFEDERGIRFHVTETSSYFRKVDGFAKRIYDNYAEYRTDYMDAVMDYYAVEADALLGRAEGISFDEKDRDIIRVSSEEALDYLPEILSGLDELYSFCYAYCGELTLELNNQARWMDFRSYDVLIRYDGKQETVLFSTGDKQLTAEKIQQIVENLKK